MSKDLSLDSKPESNHGKETKKDITAEWRIPIKGKLHKIEFEHGTASGKRVLWINDKVKSKYEEKEILIASLINMLT